MPDDLVTVPDDLMTVPDAARVFGIRQATLRSGIATGSVERHYDRARVLVSRADVAAWRARCAAGRPGRGGYRRQAD